MWLIARTRPGATLTVLSVLAWGSAFHSTSVATMPPALIALVSLLYLPLAVATTASLLALKSRRFRRWRLDVPSGWTSDFFVVGGTLAWLILLVGGLLTRQLSISLMAGTVPLLAGAQVERRATDAQRAAR
ncbi:hypothetical protein GCM10011594_41500 [Nakamurella endophytica]|uniref:Uncharacterized protein n=1 Tax=Nakamurella endophytica TaxID=1748367 RepID=A0A917TBH3_9ACTN|nr:hypothetical protein GCM10011594_41500 [Nakamurella endophytica]